LAKLFQSALTAALTGAARAVGIVHRAEMADLMNAVSPIGNQRASRHWPGQHVVIQRQQRETAGCEERPTVADLGVTKKESGRFQKLATGGSA
jgi:hypothetical protein